MRIYLVWYEENGSNGAVMDITKVVEDTYSLAPQLTRGLIASSLCGIMKANEIVTADSEEELLRMFKNVKSITRPLRKELVN